MKWHFPYLHFYKPLVAVVPDPFNNPPVITTDNLQHHNDRTILGWREDHGADWGCCSVRQFQHHNSRQSRLPVAGASFLRFSTGERVLRPELSILEAIQAKAAALS